jgi:glycosyltransferase involved in cell wall biosynthesis
LGAIHFSVDAALIGVLKAVLPLDIFVETGTFSGDTTAAVQSMFSDIYTIELSGKYHEQVLDRFQGIPHIHPILGDSATVLKKLAPSLHGRSVLYFLDAHWCVAENTAGETSQCPLLQEIGAIGYLNANSLVIIDDARLFLSPPLAPHEISQWPGFHEVLSALQKLGSDHLVSVINDQIVYYPEAIEPIVREYGYKNGVDWLKVFHQQRDYENLREQFNGVLEQLHQRDAEITRLTRIAGAQQEAIQAMQRRHLGGRLIAFFRPRIGMLYQYPPKPLTIPAGYMTNRQRLAGRMPTVSIVTPSFNQGQYIEHTIKSVFDQDYPRLEYIVQDGGSQDGTVEILRKYQHRLSAWKSVPDHGQSHALNLAFARTHGDIMGWLNSDDMLLPGALNYAVHFFMEHPEVDVVYGHRILIDEQGLEIGRWVMPPHDSRVLSWADYIPQETLFWRRKVWDKIGGQIDERFRFAMDWDLILRFRDAGVKFVRLPRFMGAFRVHPEQKTSAEITEAGKQEMAVLRERCMGRPVTRREILCALMPYYVKHVLYHKYYRMLERRGILRSVEYPCKHP